MVYRHTQIGWLILFACGLPAAALIAAAMVAQWFDAPIQVALWVTGVVLLLCAALFSALCVRVDATSIDIAFGPGFIHKRVRLADVASCRPVRNSPLWGWGVRWIGRGWLWNVSGLDAVELCMRDGTLFRLGTDEPRALDAAIWSRLGPGGAPS